MPNDKSEDPPSPDVDKGSLLKRLRELIPFGRTPDTTEALEHEIQELLEEGEEQGLISSMEEQMISSIFDFRDTLANEIMTPAAEIVSFEVKAPIGEIIEAVIFVLMSFTSPFAATTNHKHGPAGIGRDQPKSPCQAKTGGCYPISGGFSGFPGQHGAFHGQSPVIPPQSARLSQRPVAGDQP